MQAVATKSAIIRTENAFEGIIFKGVGKDYQWENINEYIVQGRVPNLKSNLNEEVVISKFLADRLNLKVGSHFNTFFMKENGYNVRNFDIVGIFNSGFQDFDATYVLGDIRHLQRINKWTPSQVGAFEVFVDKSQRGRGVCSNKLYAQYSNHSRKILLYF